MTRLVEKKSVSYYLYFLLGKTTVYRLVKIEKYKKSRAFAQKLRKSNWLNSDLTVLTNTGLND